jgi:acyl carrier protein
MEISGVVQPAGADLNREVRAILAAHARIPVDISTLADDADLFRAGMSSHASVNVMLGLENAFDVEFPDVMLKRGVFQSIANITVALHELLDDAR